MPRNRNTRVDGSPFAASTIAAVWSKGRSIPSYDPDVWRHDICGAAMKRDQYGATQSQNGWETDHIKPVTRGGGDELSNLQPLQWENNRRKGDVYPWSC